MTLEEAFRSSDFVKYRDYRMTKEDKSFIKGVLTQGNGIRRIRNLLNVVGYLPDDILPFIVKASLEFNDPSIPKRWIGTILRIYGEHKIQEEIFKIIENGSHKEVMNSMMLLYYVIPSVRLLKRGNQEERFVEFTWKWNGSNYEEYINEKVDFEQIEQISNFKKRRLDFMTSEFLKSDNLVKKYYLGLWIVRYDNWPNGNNVNLERALHEINGINFPKNQEELRQAIAGDKELINYYSNR